MQCAQAVGHWEPVNRENFCKTFSWPKYQSVATWVSLKKITNLLLYVGITSQVTGVRVIRKTTIVYNWHKKRGMLEMSSLIKWQCMKSMLNWGNKNIHNPRGLFWLLCNPLLPHLQPPPLHLCVGSQWGGYFCPSRERLEMVGDVFSIHLQDWGLELHCSWHLLGRGQGCC